MRRALAQNIESQRDLTLHLLAASVHAVVMPTRLPQNSGQDIDAEQEHIVTGKAVKKHSLLPRRGLGQRIVRV